VVRYFGGTKLGTGGLVRAYGEATKLVLAAVDSEELIDRVDFRLVLPYRVYDPFLVLVESLGIIIADTRFGEAVDVSGALPLSEQSQFSAAVADLTNGSATVDYFDE
jgi:putative IMPACT (imprinted ancient) family translation regulator